MQVSKWLKISSFIVLALLATELASAYYNYPAYDYYAFPRYSYSMRYYSSPAYNYPPAAPYGYNVYPTVRVNYRSVNRYYNDPYWKYFAVESFMRGPRYGFY